jgi:hypothetical protein
MPDLTGNCPGCARTFDRLDGLVLRAYVRGWTGDPLCQPPSAVLAAFRQMRRERTA